MSETWRVVLESGEVREVCVKSRRGVDRDGTLEYIASLGERESWAYTPRTAIMQCAMRWGCPGVVEILAPGEPTRAELAERVREACAERCEVIEDQPVRSDPHHGPYDAGEQNGARRCAAAIRSLDLAAIVGGGR